MIVPVDQSNLPEAAAIHSVSWQESHRAFCSPEFIARHTPGHQEAYLRKKMDRGSKLFMLIEEKPVQLGSAELFVCDIVHKQDVFRRDLRSGQPRRVPARF